MTNVIDMLSADLREEFPDLFVGSLVYYHVPSDALVKTRDWIAAVVGTAVEDMAPKPPRAVDAFKRAMQKVGSVGTVSFVEDGESVRYKFMCRDSGQDGEFVYRDLVVERLGSNRLSYGPVVKFKYIRSTQKMTHDVDDATFDTLPPDVMQDVTERIGEAYEKYEIERGVLGPVKIRELLRTQLEEKMFGVPGKSSGGGIYFVFDTHMATLTALKEVCEKLSEHGIEMHMVPIPNVRDQREMLIRAFENETIDECNKLMGEMAAYLRGDGDKKITLAVATGFAKKYATLAGRLAEYSDTLEQKFEEQGNRLMLMREQTLELTRNIKE